MRQRRFNGKFSVANALFSGGRLRSAFKARLTVRVSLRMRLQDEFRSEFGKEKPKCLFTIVAGNCEDEARKF